MQRQGGNKNKWRIKGGKENYKEGSTEKSKETGNVE
jgi:hypothetical protein